MESQLAGLQAIGCIAKSPDRSKITVKDGLNATACSFYSSQGATF